jgi:GNAT superfamily N-acetyltransferase
VAGSSSYCEVGAEGRSGGENGPDPSIHAAGGAGVLSRTVRRLGTERSVPVFAMQMRIRVLPLTVDVWPALEDLFDTRGPCSRCWCMYWRIGAAYRKRPAEENKADLFEIVKKGPPPGLIAFDGDLPVGWCQLTPHEAVPRIRRVDDLPVWSISCFYVRIGYRRLGVTSALITAAIKAAKRGKAPALEAYPLDPSKTPSASGTGFVTTFLRAGFKVVCSDVPARPVVRLNLR